MLPFNCDVERVVAGRGAKALEREAVATKRLVVNMDFIVELLIICLRKGLRMVDGACR